MNHSPTSLVNHDSKDSLPNSGTSKVVGCSDPIFFDGKYYGFWHEDWAHYSYGFQTPGEAQAALTGYAAAL